MSLARNFLPLATVTAIGIGTGVYIFQPAIEEQKNAYVLPLFSRQSYSHLFLPAFSQSFLSQAAFVPLTHKIPI